MAAVEALRGLLRGAAEEAWKKATAIPLPSHPQGCPIRLAGWIADLSDAERDLLRQVAGEWQNRGPTYKATLPGNRDWLDQAAAIGLDIAAWLRPATTEVDLGGQSVEIGLATDPRDVLLMGDYFRTCLSLGGMYQVSPLANGYDANKQVVLAIGRTSRGHHQVVARQLIAINSAWQLVGYRCFRVFDQQDGQREACLVAMAKFCGQLARRCGLVLGASGEPTQLSTDKWHDDGVLPWHPAAHEAWQNADSPASLRPSHVWLCLPGSPLRDSGGDVLVATA